MIDPFSLGTGIVGIVSLAIQVAKITTGYVDDVQSAPTEIKSLALQLAALSDVLKKLQELLRGGDMDDTPFEPGSGLCLVLKSCERQLECLYKRLEKKDGKGKSGISTSLARLKWPLEKKESTEATRRLYECSQAFHFCLTISNCKQMAQSSKELLQGLKDKQSQLDGVAVMLSSIPNEIKALSEELKGVVSAVVASEAEIHEINVGVKALQLDGQWKANRDILRWISPLEPEKKHQDVSSMRLEGTCQWILETPQYLAWTSGDGGSRILCCFGDPGTGKTVATSRVIDELSSCSRKAGGQDIGLAYLYCDYRDQGIQTATNLVGGILNHLLVATAPTIPDDVLAVYEQKCMRERKSIELSDVMSMLQSVCKKFGTIFVCVDALDECNDVAKLLMAIKDMPSSIRIFTTGRKHITKDVETHFGDAPNILIEASEDDIRSYVKSKIDENRLREPDIMDENLEEEIQRKIVHFSHGMFLLPALRIRMVLDARTKSKRRQALNNLPPDLDQAFGSTIERITNQTKDAEDQAMRIIRWIYLAERPLQVEELLHALATETGQEELDHDNFPSRSTFLDCCLGLVIVDIETSTARFVHYTFQEYLRKQTKFHQLGHDFGHENIAQICLTYLMFEPDGRSLVMRTTTRSVHTENQNLPWERQLPLLSYAACHWGWHARRSESSGVEITSSIISYLSKRVERRWASTLLLYYFANNGRELPRRHIPIDPKVQSFSALHIVAHFGLHRVLNKVLQLSSATSISTDSEDYHGQTPLLIAAGKGHEAVVKLLVERDDVDTNSKDSYGRTPLLIAAIYGHEAVVKLLVERDDVDADLKDSYGRTPLSIAAMYGHQAVVKLLVERDDVNTNSKDSYGRTPLLMAAENGHEAVVKLLAEQDVDADLKDSYGRTPLLRAVESGYEAIVKLLVERDDVEADSKDSSGRTPLLLAADNGHEAVVKLLVERDDVDANSKDSGGQTPLLIAVMYGHEAVVKLLVEQDDVDADLKDSSGQTPLSIAAMYGHQAVVKLLVERDDVDADSKDSSGRTPLLLAADNGHEAVVKLLVERDDVDADWKDSSGRTPLLMAADNGHEAVVKLLVERDDVDADSKDSRGRTPLLIAAIYGHKAVVKLLVERDDVDADSKDSSGQTPLSIAAIYGHEAVVKLLVERDDVDADSKDSSGQTPLSIAADNGHEAVVKLLVKRDDVEADSRDSTGRTPLSIAAENGHEAVVKLLVERDDVEADSKDSTGRTPLSIAAENGHEAVVKLLVERDDVDTNSKDSTGQTPLSIVTGKGHEVLVKLLVERDDVDTDSKDRSGQTPLSIAAGKGYEALVKLLVERDDVDTNSKDSRGQTPLSIAAGRGYKAVVKLLVERDDIVTDLKDNNGWTPLFWAARRGHKAVVRLLEFYAKDKY